LKTVAALDDGQFGLQVGATVDPEFSGMGGPAQEQRAGKVSKDWQQA
jgi:hypothetical protein